MDLFWRQGLGLSGADAVPREVASWKEAQSACNFVVLEPTQLPGGCTWLDQPTVRPESRQRWASLMFRVGNERRKIRVKQFHYDWTAPTVSATNLVDSPKVPFLLRGVVGWHGTDYKARPATCWQYLRTTVELSVETGAFDKEEIEAFLSGLKPADADHAPLIAREPFAQISYTVRKGAGPWGYDEVAGLKWTESLEEIRQHANLPIYIPKWLPHEFQWDSGGYAPGKRVALLFRHMGNLVDSLWLHWGEGVEVPGPRGFDQISSQQVQLRGASGWAGATTQEFGGRRAFWREADLPTELISRASAQLSHDKFLTFIASLELQQ